MAEAQSPLGGSRPLLGLAASAFAPLGASVLGLAAGRAAAAGLLGVGDERAGLPERSLSIPLPILAAVDGLAVVWPKVTLVEAPDLALPRAILDEAKARARAVTGGLVIRSASALETTAASAHVAAALGRGLARAEPDAPSGLAAWLIAAGRIPLFAPRLGPGERWAPPALAPYAGPWIVTTGLDGLIDYETPPDDWTLPTPDAAERARLWRAAGVSKATAERAAESYRHGAGRIGEAAARARLQAARRGADRPGAGRGDHGGPGAEQSGRRGRRGAGAAAEPARQPGPAA